MLVNLEGQQGKDGGQRRKDGSRQPFVIKTKQKQTEKMQQVPRPVSLSIHPFHIQWLHIDLPI